MSGVWKMTYYTKNTRTHNSTGRVCVRVCVVRQTASPVFAGVCWADSLLSRWHQVKVMTEKELLGYACEQFLGKTVMEIKSVILQTLEGHLRAILGGYFQTG